ncbi:NFX1-type zinc finger-containing protein 1 [Armadillidium vulgare]|nr:NFX1-type zinc finger-containing protein 1 [Armadillidium vulgare]
MCRDVQIRVLDDYQGEENDIILLSLVRSNDRGKIGFMNIENRINVALSRAKHGMYIMGNMTQMSEKSPVWKQIHEKLINNDNIGSELELQCKVHPFETSSIKLYEDFEIKSPNGGCTLPCEQPFPSCEHKCPYTCHASHKYVKCKFPCSKLICDQQHPCPKMCFEECGKCKVLINKMLLCGHFQPVMCSTPIENFKCPKLIPKEMPSCKHVIDLECHIDPNSVSCTANCEAMLSCGHQCNRKCHPLYDVNHLQYKCYFECERKPPLCEFNHKCIKKCYQECGTCTVPMDRELKCGHIMNNIECGTLEKDIKCDKKCHRILKCGHVCSSQCGEGCGDCTEIVKKVFPSCNHRIRGTCSVLENIKFCPVKCEKILSCGHICKKTCGEKCGDCMEEIDKIIPECNHIAKVPCSISPSIEYCYGNCTKTLVCDHKCAEKCNEPCTSNCENLVENYCSRNHKVLVKNVTLIKKQVRLPLV